MILVTGGTGLVGTHLLLNLVKDGEKVRATYRREQTLKRTKHLFSLHSETPNALYNKIEWVEADITNIPKLQDAFKGITHVYHCAAFVSFEPDKYHTLRKINIEGTSNIVNLSISHRVIKLCYISSIAALGQQHNPETLINEQTEYNPETENSVYAITKYGAELEVWRGTQEGLNAIIVNPGIILGAGFWYGSGSVSLFKMVYKGMSFYTKGITGFVDVWDVVGIMQQLMKSNITNQGYVLVSENLSFKDVFKNIANELKVKSPHKEAKSWLLNVLWRLDWLRNKLFRKRRRITKQTVKSLQSISNYDNSKIEQALGFRFKPINKSIKEVSRLFLKDFK